MGHQKNKRALSGRSLHNFSDFTFKVKSWACVPDTRATNYLFVSLGTVCRYVPAISWGVLHYLFSFDTLIIIFGGLAQRRDSESPRYKVMSKSRSTVKM
jgi:hypothetical protein